MSNPKYKQLFEATDFQQQTQKTSYTDTLH